MQDLILNNIIICCELFTYAYWVFYMILNVVLKCVFYILYVFYALSEMTK